MSAGSQPAIAFPGHVVKAGSDDKANVLAIQRRLNLPQDGVFSAETQEAVQLFQARSLDFQNRPLTVDGQVGPMTWAALFRSPVAPS